MKNVLAGLGLLLALAVFSALVWVNLPRTTAADWYSDLEKQAATRVESSNQAREDSKKNAYSSNYFQNIRDKKPESDIVRKWIMINRKPNSVDFPEALAAFVALQNQRKEALSKELYLVNSRSDAIDLNSVFLVFQAEIAELQLFLKKDDRDLAYRRTALLLQFANAVESEPRLVSLAGSSQCRLELFHQLSNVRFLAEWEATDLERFSEILNSTLSPRDQFLVTATAEWDYVERGVRNGLKVQDISWIWKFPGSLERELRIARNTHVELLKRVRAGKYHPPPWLIQPSSNDLFMGRCGVVTAISALSLDGPLELWSRARAIQWGLATCFSLAKFHRAHGRYPATLEELPDEELMQDPIARIAKYSSEASQTEFTIPLPVKLPAEWGDVYTGEASTLFEHKGNKLTFRLPES